MITNELVKQSIDYIVQHLDEDISIEDVANYCHYSKYHFSRVFKAETGESIYAFIKRLKMEQSALKIKHERDKPITEIAVGYGYTSSNYSSRTFLNLLGNCFFTDRHIKIHAGLVVDFFSIIR